MSSQKFYFETKIELFTVAINSVEIIKVMYQYRRKPIK